MIYRYRMKALIMVPENNKKVIYSVITSTLTSHKNNCSEWLFLSVIFTTFPLSFDAHYLIPMYAHYLIPMYAHYLNPMYAHYLNPVYAHYLNPVYAHYLNPVYAHYLNPIGAIKYCTTLFIYSLIIGVMYRPHVLTPQSGR